MLLFSSGLLREQRAEPSFYERRALRSFAYPFAHPADSWMGRMKPAHASTTSSPRTAHACECVACGREWRQRLVWHTDKDGEWWSWPQPECPSCGSSYWEWLSHDVAPTDVYLTREVHLVPLGRLVVTYSSRAPASPGAGR